MLTIRFVCQVNGGTLECPLTETGTQSLMLFSQFGNTTTGSFHLYIQRLDSPAHCKQLKIGGPPASGKISKVGAVDCYTFAGNSGDTIVATVVVNSGSLAPELDVFTPAGTSACAGQSPIQCTLSVTGSWTIVLDDNPGPGTGTFTITLGKK